MSGEKDLTFNAEVLNFLLKFFLSKIGRIRE